MALALRCTVEELGQRLTAPEFEEWKLMFRAEDLHPAGDRRRHAQLLAAIHNGPLSRRDRRAWAAKDFEPGSPWDALEARKTRTAVPKGGKAGKRGSAGQAMGFAAHARAVSGR